jgi:hypothetical protein
MGMAVFYTLSRFALGAVHQASYIDLDPSLITLPLLCRITKSSN